MPEELLKPSLISERFRGFLPVVIDVETGGFNSGTDALLEIAAVILEMDSQGYLQIKDSFSKNIEPFPGAIVEQSALEFTGIDIVGVVKELTTIISEEEEINMKSLNFDTNDGVFEGEIMLYVYDKSHLEKLIKKLRNINGIEKVVRIE